MKACSVLFRQQHFWRQSLLSPSSLRRIPCSANLLPPLHHRQLYRQQHGLQLHRTNDFQKTGLNRRSMSTSKEILGTLSVKELRKIVKDKGLDDKDCIDKDSLIERAAEALMMGDKKAEQPEDVVTVKSDHASKTASATSSSSLSSTAATESSSVSQTQEQKDEEMKRKIMSLFASDTRFMKLFAKSSISDLSLLSMAQSAKPVSSSFKHLCLVITHHMLYFISNLFTHTIQ